MLECPANRLLLSAHGVTVGAITGQSMPIGGVPLLVSLPPARYIVLWMVALSPHLATSRSRLSDHSSPLFSFLVVPVEYVFCLSVALL